MDWEEDILARELAEKRSRAPGWLDREEKLLEPERVGRGGGSADAGGENVEMTDRVDGRAGNGMWRTLVEEIFKGCPRDWWGCGGEGGDRRWVC